MIKKSSKKINPIRGTHDLMNNTIKVHDLIISKFKKISENYNYSPISTPIIEYSDVFSRSLGSESDVVMKEMYTFFDKSNVSITMRPEGTAGIARAIISNSLTQSLPLKLYYNGPMFRYERPQKGRLRQFHQIGVEMLGISQYSADLEVINLGNNFLKALGIANKVSLEINSLGDRESRQNYLNILLNYLNTNKNKLSPISLQRLKTNPLRILDSKDKMDKDIIKNAPILKNFLSKEAKIHFDKLINLLRSLNIPFKLNNHLVRGLDYYCHTTFEFVTKNFDNNFAVLAGGRYDGLISQLGGPEIPGIGWAAGIERMELLVNKQFDKEIVTTIVPVEEKNLPLAFKIAEELRSINIRTDISHSGNMKKKLQNANKINSKYVIIIGEEEVKSSKLKIKNLYSGIQEEVSFDNLKYFLSK